MRRPGKWCIVHGSIEEIFFFFLRYIVLSSWILIKLWLNDGPAERLQIESIVEGCISKWKEGMVLGLKWG